MATHIDIDKSVLKNNKYNFDNKIMKVTGFS